MLKTNLQNHSQLNSFSWQIPPYNNKIQLKNQNFMEKFISMTKRAADYYLNPDLKTE